MSHPAQHDPSLTVSLAMLLGTAFSFVAHHVRLPGIVLFLPVGVLLGPELLGWLQPHALGTALDAIVGFAVAIILFEGGMVLNFKYLRKQAKTVRRLVGIGAVVTTAGAALLARFLMHWSWQTSLLFGTLVVVTGPTVINPIVQRIHLKHKLAVILEAEGIFIDAVGATVAIVMMELVLSPSVPSWLAPGIWGVLLRLGFGGIIGLIAGYALGYALLRWHELIPEGTENILVMSFAFALFVGCNNLVGESGITAVIVAGIIVGEMQSSLIDDVKDFKGQLATLLIATLFILLSANVRLSDLAALGFAGVVVVLGLMLVVRPVVVFLSTAGSGLSTREKLFLSWLAPRGIVAAAVASLFAHNLTRAGNPEGQKLYALVFLVIACTVTLQGLSSKWVAQTLGLRRSQQTGFLFLGANILARTCARALESKGQQVALMDSNFLECRAAEEAGFKVIYGNALDERTLRKASVDSRATCIGLTRNDSVNYLFGCKVRNHSRLIQFYLAINPNSTSVTPHMLDEIDSRLLFGQPYRIQRWLNFLERDQAQLEDWQFSPNTETNDNNDTETNDNNDTETTDNNDTTPFPSSLPRESLLPVIFCRNDQANLIDASYQPQEGDILRFAVHPNPTDDPHTWLQTHGWQPYQTPENTDSTEETNDAIENTEATKNNDASENPDDAASKEASEASEDSDDAASTEASDDAGHKEETKSTKASENTEASESSETSEASDSAEEPDSNER